MYQVAILQKHGYLDPTGVAIPRCNGFGIRIVVCVYQSLTLPRDDLDIKFFAPNSHCMTRQPMKARQLRRSIKANQSIQAKVLDYYANHLHSYKHRSSSIIAHNQINRSTKGFDTRPSLDGSGFASFPCTSSCVGIQIACTTWEQLSAVFKLPALPASFMGYWYAMLKFYSVIPSVCMCVLHRVSPNSSIFALLSQLR